MWRRLTLATDIAPLAGLERLNAADRPLVAVALSGGGDLLALLHLAKRWADREDRALIALTVDHGLQRASADWSRFCAERARRLGVAHRTLAWIGDKPATGLPAAARAARQALLAEAARAAGARVILMAHTADDLMEAELMRAAGVSAPSPRQWSPSPAWPAGRGVFLLRPLLQRRRAELRALLGALGETWIEDPANDDPRYARTLARRHLSRCTSAVATVAEPLAPSSALQNVRHGPGGEFTVPRDRLDAASPAERRRLIGALALSAAGTTRPPPAASLDRLVAKLSEPAFAITLAGARFEADATDLLVCREAGEFARGGLQPLDLPLGDSVFDGRFLLTARQAGYRVVPLAGRAARLSHAERDRLKQFHRAVRPGLPAILAPSGAVTCPLLAPDAAIGAAPLGLARLRGALGAIADEASAACG